MNHTPDLTPVHKKSEDEVEVKSHQGSVGFFTRERGMRTRRDSSLNNLKNTPTYKVVWEPIKEGKTGKDNESNSNENEGTNK